MGSTFKTSSSMLVIVLLSFVLVSTCNAQGRCIYEACNFNRDTTPVAYHDLLTTYCRRCCSDIWKLNQAINIVNAYPTSSLGLSQQMIDAATDIRDVFETVFNLRANRMVVADQLELAKEELQSALETLEQGLEHDVWGPLDNAVENAIDVAAQASELVGQVAGGWNFPAVIELMEAITAEAGYAVEILEMIAAILLL